MNIPIVAEPIYHIGTFHVTNTLVNSTLVMLFCVGISFAIKSRLSTIPRGLQNTVESLIEFLLSYFDQVTNDRKKSIRFLPVVGSLFFFILLSNWLGLFPGAGSIGVWQMHEGHMELIPLFRSANSDLNMTLAMAVFSVIASHLFGMFSLGFFVHWNKFIQLGTIWKALRSFKPVNILTALVEAMVGLIELFSEVAKVVSLSLRLFGNVFAGEVLLTVISGLVAYAVPLPFMGLELLVGVVQATVFALLVLVYLTVATDQPHGEEKTHHETAVAHAATAS